MTKIVLHPRARQVLDRASTRARLSEQSDVVRGLVARIDYQGTVTIDLDPDHMRRELIRSIEVGTKDRTVHHSRSRDDDDPSAGALL